MLNARRAEPTPMDFDFALKRFDLPLASIQPHLKPPIPISKTRIQLDTVLPEQDKPEIQAGLLKILGGELSGESDKKERPYVPRKFIAFPSKHTYKWTDKEPSRETDPRKIREEAAKAARHAEESLRRLVKVSKAGKEKDVKLAASRDPTTKARHELWEKTMAGLMAGKDHTMHGDEDQSMIVNSESQYFRKGASRKKRAPMAPDKRTEV